MEEAEAESSEIHEVWEMVLDRIIKNISSLRLPPRHKTKSTEEEGGSQKIRFSELGVDDRDLKTKTNAERSDFETGFERRGGFDQRLVTTERQNHAAETKNRT